MIRTLDLFSGIGGFSLGLRWAGGFETVGFCEIDPLCRHVLAKHWPEVWTHDDIRTITTDLVADRAGRVDCIVGGFPCQDISVAGKGAGIGGKRSGLWSEMLRLIDGIRPRWCVVENVPALRTRGADDVLAALEAIGYSCRALVVGAWCVGAKQKRNRVWIIANLDAARRANVQGRQRQTATAHAIADSHDRLSERMAGWWDIGDLGRAVHGVSDRMDRKRVEMLGNAVVPQVVAAIGRAIMEADE